MGSSLPQKWVQEWTCGEGGLMKMAEDVEVLKAKGMR
jgi:hypothetical protein